MKGVINRLNMLLPRLLVSMLFCLHIVPISVFAEIELEPTDVSCHGEADGSITTTVTGGTPPYTYDWSPSGNGANPSGLEAGTYTVTVTDANDCTLTGNTTINEPPKIDVSISGGGGQITFCEQDGPPTITLNASASGGVPPYTLSWPGGTKSVSSSGTYTCTATDSEGCSDDASVMVEFVPVVCSRDPNDIIGPEGFGEQRWVSVNDVLPYTVRFENDPDFATAPAQIVTVDLPISPNLNIFSLRLGDFGFNNLIYEVPPNSTFYTERIDVVVSLGVFVDVIAGIDVTQRKVFWIFESIDPLTGLEPSDALLGFLPVNDTAIHNGEGFVSFTIEPKASAATGDSITAIADIVFDDNEAILTPEVFNLIDALPPTTAMNALPATADSTAFVLNWSGQDDQGGSGIGAYDIYAAENGGAFELFQQNVTEDSTIFNGDFGSTYEFFSIGIDNTGNREALKTAGEAEIDIAGVELAVRVLLQGAFNPDSGIMNDDLRTKGYLPLVEPYTNLGFTHIGNLAGETTESSVLEVAGPNAIVDWVLLELRKGDDTSSTVVATRSALLQRDGDVVDIDGTSAVSFENSAPGNYYVSVRHRNHLRVMTATALPLTSNASLIDFSDTATATFGIEAQYEENNRRMVWAGDVVIDGVIKYSGLHNDRDPILVRIGGTVPSAVEFGYFAEDVNMNGIVKYGGFNNDRDIILVNIGGDVPTAVRTEQIPQ